jgi:FkbM family methyltransferase
MGIRRILRHALGLIADCLTFDQAILISRTLLASKGFGSGGNVSTSGEGSVFELVGGNAPVLFDVGAHSGEYTEAFLKRHPGGRAYCFEPSEAHFELLKGRLGHSNGVQLFKLALGAGTGEVNLYKNAEVSGLASLTRRQLDHLEIKMDRVERVQMETLDNAAAATGVECIDLLKIDVEGHELDVLKNAQRMFRDNKIGLVQFEFGGCNLDTHTNLKEFFYFFKEHRFEIGVIQPSGHIHTLSRYSEFYEHYRTTNFVASPKKTAET